MVACVQKSLRRAANREFLSTYLEPARKPLPARRKFLWGMPFHVQVRKKETEQRGFRAHVRPFPDDLDSPEWKAGAPAGQPKHSVRAARANPAPVAAAHAGRGPAKVADTHGRPAGGRRRGRRAEAPAKTRPRQSGALSFGAAETDVRHVIGPGPRDLRERREINSFATSWSSKASVEANLQNAAILYMLSIFEDRCSGARPRRRRPMLALAGFEGAIDGPATVDDSRGHTGKGHRHDPLRFKIRGVECVCGTRYQAISQGPEATRTT